MGTGGTPTMGISIPNSFDFSPFLILNVDSSVTKESENEG